jgi:hypothetical protein
MADSQELSDLDSLSGVLESGVLSQILDGDDNSASSQQNVAEQHDGTSGASALPRIKESQLSWVDVNDDAYPKPHTEAAASSRGLEDSTTSTEMSTSMVDLPQPSTADGPSLENSSQGVVCPAPASLTWSDALASLEMPASAPASKLEGKGGGGRSPLFGGSYHSDSNSIASTSSSTEISSSASMPTESGHYPVMLATLVGIAIGLLAAHVLKRKQIERLKSLLTAKESEVKRLTSLFEKYLATRPIVVRLPLS